MKRLLTGLLLAATLAACGGDSSPDSPPEAIAAAAYRPAGPKKITVFTMVNNRTGKGGHTALLVNGSQQVIFDPAGSFRDERVVESGDVLYGMSPSWVHAYKSAHARDTYHVVSQELTVTPEQAETALRLVQTNGAVPAASPRAETPCVPDSDVTEAAAGATPARNPALRKSLRSLEAGFPAPGWCSAIPTTHQEPSFSSPPPFAV